MEFHEKEREKERRKKSVSKRHKRKRREKFLSVREKEGLHSDFFGRQWRRELEALLRETKKRTIEKKKLRQRHKEKEKEDLEMDHKLLDYEQEFLNDYALFKATLTAIKERPIQPEVRRREINKCTRLLTAADTALRQLELESRMKGRSGEWEEEYKSLQTRTDNYRRELQQAFTELRGIRSAVERLLLLNHNEDCSLQTTSTLQRQRLLNVADKAQKGLQTLESSRVLALETEVLGSTVVTELHSQRQTIQQTISRVTTVREGLHEASATLQRIMRAAFRTKMIAYALLVFVILTLAYISLRKFVPSTSSSPAAAPTPPAAQLKTAAREETKKQTKPLSTDLKDTVNRSSPSGLKKTEESSGEPGVRNSLKMQPKENHTEVQPGSGS